MRKWILYCLCLVLIISSVVSVQAASPKIADDAGLLTSDQTQTLEALARQLASKYGIDVVIVTVDSLGGKSSERFADEYYDAHGYGIGDSYSGILLLLSMEYRDWAISTCGDGIYALTDYGIQQVFEKISWNLSENRYYEAFYQYLQALEPYLEAFRSGDPIDGNPGEYQGQGSYEPGTMEEIIHYGESSKPALTLTEFGISLFAGVIAAGIALLVMRAQMNTAKPQRGAMSYMRSGTYTVNQQRDIFLYSQVRKVKRSENNHTGGHGSSVHRSSSGRSHGGGHGKF